MRTFLADLDAKNNALLLEDGSGNTRQNTKFTADLLRPRGVSRILLVTSVIAMLRALRMFGAQEFISIPAATDHEARNRFNAVDWLPDAGALDGSARAIKELVGRWVDN